MSKQGCVETQERTSFIFSLIPAKHLKRQMGFLSFCALFGNQHFMGLVLLVVNLASHNLYIVFQASQEQLCQITVRMIYLYWLNAFAYLICIKLQYKVYSL